MLVKMGIFPKEGVKNQEYLSCHHLVVVWVVGLGPGGDSERIPAYERDCYLGVSRFESQTTNPDHLIVFLVRKT